jgi:hypothetical protein
LEVPVETDAIGSARSVLGVVAAGQWKSALFTTYTLSLTYLESHLLPALRRSSCDSLTVLADLAGYRDSLMEQRSQGVGRDYSVLPVRVDGGIFHPKLVYLEGRDRREDVLLVGSGNLTYPGHGGNLEVLEVLRPSTTATAFREAADFFEELLRTPRVQVPDSSAMERCARSLREAAEGGQDMEQAHFVHCLRSSGHDQLVAAARAIAGQWRELLVLSPYHHPQAKPVLDLAEQIGVKSIVAGVSPNPDEPSSFPFEGVRAGFPGLRVAAPAPRTKPKRPLHAKWFELRGDSEALVLTGSFNATHASFASVTNVECAVLRVVPAPTSCWADAVQPRYERAEFPQRVDAQAPCIFAVLSESRQLHGTVLAAGHTGIWRVQLESADQTLLDAEVVVDESGNFAIHLPVGIDVTRTGAALQLTLKRPGLNARGWVQVAQMLQLGARNRRLVDVTTRLLSGTDTADDRQAILDIIAEEASHLVQAVLVPHKPASAETVHAQRKPVQISREQFEGLPADSDRQPGDGHHSLVDALSAQAHGWDVLKQILTALTRGAPQAGEEKSGGSGTDDPFAGIANRNAAADDDDAPRRSSSKKTRSETADVYEVLQHQLKLVNEKLAAQPAAQASALQLGKLRLLAIWSAVVLRVQVGTENDADGALPFYWNTWLKEVCSVRLPAEEKAWLANQVCGVAAACAYWLMGRSPTAAASAAGRDEVLQALDESRELHRRVEAFFGEHQLEELVLRQAAEWLADAHPAALVNEQVEQALEALRQVLDKPTERQVLRLVLADGATSHEQEISQMSAGLAAVLRQVSTAKQQAPEKLSFVEIASLDRCPNVHCSRPYVTSLGRTGVRSLDSDINWRLKKFGVYRCRCGQLLVARETA